MTSSNVFTDFETEKLNKFVESLTDHQAAKLIEVLENKFTLKNRSAHFFKEGAGTGESVTDC